MSNYLAVAAVTSTLSQWLSEKATGVLNGAKTTIGRPKDDLKLGINIFLYQVMHNPDHRNDDLPTRRAGDTTLSERPKAVLDLYYLFTFYGSEQDLEPQILLGSMISVLHAQPVITQDMLRREIQRRIDDDVDDILAKYEVSGQIQSISFTPLSYNTEEFSKLWSVLFGIPYTLSVAYKASVVFVEAEVTPQRALPVQGRDVYVLPFHRPVIDKVSSAEGDSTLIVYDSQILIKGHRLKGDPTKVSIGEVKVTIDPADTENTITDTGITLSLDSALFASETLRAGIQGVSVIHPVMMGDPKVEHYGFESNIKPVVLSPMITGTMLAGTDLTITVNPHIGKTQKVLALLNEYESTSDVPNAYALKAPDNNGISDDTITETDSITFSVEDVESGDYLLRIQVDGAESPLEISTDPSDPKYVSPQVNIP
jgi:hypothetical protein